MFGLVCGLLLAYQPDGVQSVPLQPLDVCVNGRTVEIFGVDGSPSFSWRDQKVFPGPPTKRQSENERGWFQGRINGRPVRLWGWQEDRALYWRWDEQRLTCSDARSDVGDEVPPTARPDPLQAGDLPDDNVRTDKKPESTRVEDEDEPVESGVTLPSGYQPLADPSTGALLLGVDPDRSDKDPERTILASDAATAKEAEEVRAFYAERPDESAKAIARRLPKVVSPTTWGWFAGYTIDAAIARVGGVALLSLAVWHIYKRHGAAT